MGSPREAVFFIRECLQFDSIIEHLEVNKLYKLLNIHHICMYTCKMYIYSKAYFCFVLFFDLPYLMKIEGRGSWTGVN